MSECFMWQLTPGIYAQCSLYTSLSFVYHWEEICQSMPKPASSLTPGWLTVETPSSFTLTEQVLFSLRETDKTMQWFKRHTSKSGLFNLEKPHGFSHKAISDLYSNVILSEGLIWTVLNQSVKKFLYKWYTYLLGQGWVGFQGQDWIHS